MTAAAFRACFTDWKLIRGRKCVQIVFEVPVEAADEAYHVLGGMPDPGKSVWCAIARLQLRDTDAGESAGPLSPDREAAISRASAVAASRSPRTPVAPEKRLAQQAGICCTDLVFRRFLVERDYAVGHSEDTAVAAVRQVCGVKSRSEIVPGTQAGDLWHVLYGEFLAWRDHDMPAGEAA